MTTGRREERIAEALLVGVTAVWGWTFVLVKDAVAAYPALPFLALRFALATVVLIPIARWRWRVLQRADAGTPAPKPGSVSQDDSGASGDDSGALENDSRVFASAALKGLLEGGMVLGLFLSAGYVFQTLGLARTTSSNAGFITGLFVVLVPILQGLLWHRWGGRSTVVAVASATVGLFLLSGGATGDLQLVGDGLVFLCAVSFAAHILATSRYAGRLDPVILTTIQLGVVAVACLLLSLGGAATGLTEPLPGLPSDPQVILALVVTAVLASALAFFIQTYAQRHAAPTRTAVIMTMEPVFAGLFGYVLAGDRLTPIAWLGALLILVGMLVAELWPEGGSVQVVPEGQAWADAEPEAATQPVSTEGRHGG